MKREYSLIMIILILLSVLGGSTQAMRSSDSLSYVNSNLESEEIENISIRSNDALLEFADEKDLSGDGSEEAPYVLANYTIDAMGENYSVHLKNIELHFVIKNCKIYNSSQSAIKINGVSNFTLENSIVKNSTHGIEIDSSENISIGESRIYNTISDGVSIISSENISIGESRIYNTISDGVRIISSENISIVKSRIYNTTSDGVRIISSENMIIKSSNIYENNRGMYLEEGANNTITNNNISNNERWGIRILESSSNLIYHNIFYQNGDKAQAHDNGDNQWYQDEKGGNHWSDYQDRYPNANESIDKGVWDTPYEVLPENGNRDRYPLISPVGPPMDVRTRAVRDEYVEVTWNSPRYSIRYPVEEILLYRGKERENLSVYEVMNSTAQLFHDENVTEGETYYYGLIASNEKYASVMSGIQSAQPDTTRPEVQRHYSVGNEIFEEDEDVPLNATIEVVFSEEMDENSIRISVEDEEGKPVEGDLNGEGTEFYFEPTYNLSYETTYHVSVTGKDIAENWLKEGEDRWKNWTFTTVLDTGIIIGRVTDEEGEPLENVKIYFDEDHQTFTNASGGFQIKVPSGNITLELTKKGYVDEEREFQVNQSEEKEIENLILREQEDIISRWFWPMALAGGGILLLGMIALFMFFYHWEEEEPLLEEDIYDIDYEDVDEEEFESWWEDEDS